MTKGQAYAKFSLLTLTEIKDRVLLMAGPDKQMNA